jgi:hypothetical protein
MVISCSFVCWAYSSTLKMDAVCSTEMSVNIYWTTGHHIPDGSTLDIHLCRNFTSQWLLLWDFTYLNVIIGRTALFEPHPSLEVSFLWISQQYFFLQSKVVGLGSNPQPGGPAPCIYIPQWQGGPIISPGIRFPLCRPLLITGLWWWYSNPRLWCIVLFCV